MKIKSVQTGVFWVAMAGIVVMTLCLVFFAKLNIVPIVRIHCKKDVYKIM